MRHHRPRRTFEWSDAKLLLSLLDPSAAPYRGKAHTKQLAATRLRNAGFVSASDQPTVSDEVLFSLGLADVRPSRATTVVAS